MGQGENYFYCLFLSLEVPACECLRTLDGIGAGGLAMSAKFTPRASNRPQSDPDSRAQAPPRQGADSFQVIGPSLCILQLNVEGLSAAKRSALQEIAEQHKVDIICLQETHVDKDISSRFTINGFSLLSYHLHPKFGRATYIKNSLAGATASQHNDLWDACKLDQFSIINVYKPPSIDWTDSNLPRLCHLPLYMWATLIVTTMTGVTNPVMKTVIN